jgi:hypothetical protein
VENSIHFINASRNVKSDLPFRLSSSNLSFSLSCQDGNEPTFKAEVTHQIRAMWDFLPYGVDDGEMIKIEFKVNWKNCFFEQMHSNCNETETKFQFN